MKSLLFALLCSFIGFGAYAAGSTPENTNKSIHTLEINQSNVTKDTQEKPDKEENVLRRRQIAFIFHDNCGGTLTVYVSAGDAVPTSSMATTAYNYACGYANAGGGCF